MNTILIALFGACVALAFNEAVHQLRRQRAPKQPAKPAYRWLCYSEQHQLQHFGYDNALLYKVRTPVGATTVPATFIAVSQDQADAYCDGWPDAECWGVFENPELVPSGEVSQWG